MSAQPFEPRRAYKTALMPERAAANGPITSARLRRAGLVYLALAAAGLALGWLAASPRLQAFGLGLIVPGGGFLLYPVGSFGNTVAHVGLTLATWFVFGLALFAWFGSGNILAPIAVWLGAALAAASMGHHATWPLARLAVPGLVALLAAGAVLARRRAVPAAIARRRQRNEYLTASAGRATPRDSGTGRRWWRRCRRRMSPACASCSTAPCSPSSASTASTGSSSFRLPRSVTR